MANETLQSSEIPMVSMGEQLKDMVAPIRQALEQGERHAEYLKALAKKQNDENNKMRRALSVIDPDYRSPQSAKPRGKSRPRPGATGFGIALEAVEPFAKKIVELAEADPDGFVTQPQVYKALGANQTKCSAAFSYLREIGMIGKAGRQHRQRSERWRLMDPTAFDTALRAFKEESNG